MTSKYYLRNARGIMAENADVSITVEDEAIVQLNQQFTDIQSVLQSLGNKLENSGSSMTFCPSFFSGLPTDDPISWKLVTHAHYVYPLFSCLNDRKTKNEKLAVYQVSLCKDIAIPPMSEKVIVVIRGSSLPDKIFGLTSALPNLLSSGLMTAKSISKVDKNQILFGVGNFTDKPITLSKQCNVAEFVCLSKHDQLYDFESLDNGNRVCNVSKSSIDVKNQADKTLSVDQVSQLQNLVDKYNDVFVGKDSKLGKCSLLKYKIKVPQGTAPVRQRAYKCQTAFDELKESLSQPPILGYPQYDQPFRLYTDASSFSLGAVLCQVENGIERVICYVGKSLSASEKNYGIMKRVLSFSIWCKTFRLLFKAQ
ncbi:unnamed protein product [Mytilus coruscus]|uniref:Reverse transcriptase/retrotransposon-derived protein RNase H-like domain-containing protein n=1 Tax=Mytilus coruscus TaxID=42192 RepID=A0A6J8AA65_MYTCO|nr:unnamed protein product [Mytilus coruscus]